MATDHGSSSPTGPSYFYDFITTIETSYPYASFAAIVEEVAFARAVGPVAANLQPTSEGVYEMMVPIGFGHMARIELEFDRVGRLQPVMGEIIKR